MTKGLKETPKKVEQDKPSQEKIIPEKETKNTIRYKETTVPPRVVTIYIQKWALGNKPPEKISVHVQSIEAPSVPA